MRKRGIEINNLDFIYSKRDVRQYREKLEHQVYNRIPRSVMDMIIEIQDREPGFKYSTYLRPIVVEAIRKKYVEVVKGESKNE